MVMAEDGGYIREIHLPSVTEKETIHFSIKLHYIRWLTASHHHSLFQLLYRAILNYPFNLFSFQQPQSCSTSSLFLSLLLSSLLRPPANAETLTPAVFEVTIKAAVSSRRRHPRTRPHAERFASRSPHARASPLAPVVALSIPERREYSSIHSR